MGCSLGFWRSSRKRARPHCPTLVDATARLIWAARGARSSKLRTMAAVIQRVSTATTNDWSTFWRESDSATYFHSPEWADIWSQHTHGRTRPEPKLVTFSDGRQALLPLCFERRFGGLLSRYVSSPEATFGGWPAPSSSRRRSSGAARRWIDPDRRVGAVRRHPRGLADRVLSRTPSLSARTTHHVRWRPRTPARPLWQG